MELYESKNGLKESYLLVHLIHGDIKPRLFNHLLLLALRCHASHGELV
jgi:hypothetical protein